MYVDNKTHAHFHGRANILYNPNYIQLAILKYKKYKYV